MFRVEPTKKVEKSFFRLPRRVLISHQTKLPAIRAGKKRAFLLVEVVELGKRKAIHMVVDYTPWPVPRSADS